MVGKVPEQKAARKAYGNALIDEVIAHPTMNARCYRCARHQGLACACTAEEKGEWLEAHGKRYPWQVDRVLWSHEVHPEAR